MSEMSDYLEDQLIKHLFRTGSFTKPTVLAFCLLTAATNDAGIGQFSTGSGTEVTNAGAYARIDRPPLDANWAATAGGNGQTSNVAAITYSQATASWGTVTDMAITDSATYDAGNMLFYSPVTTSRTIDSGDTAEFAIGAITVTLA
jgi:hypothetical protein